MVVLVLLVIALVFSSGMIFRVVQRSRRASERSQLAASRGWQFSEGDPSLVNRWSCEPFSRPGDKREVFGVIRGDVNGVKLTAFDYRRRTRRVLRGSDEYDTVTVWALQLPQRLPAMHAAPRPTGLAARALTKMLEKLDGEPDRVLTGDPEFDPKFTVTSRYPEFVNAVLTPEMRAWLRANDLPGWATEGQDLVACRDTQVRGTKTAEIVSTAEKLTALIARFPQTVWQR